MSNHSEGLDAVHIPQLAQVVELVVHVQLHGADPSTPLLGCQKGLSLGGFPLYEQFLSRDSHRG